MIEVPLYPLSGCFYAHFTESFCAQLFLLVLFLSRDNPSSNVSTPIYLSESVSTPIYLSECFYAHLFTRVGQAGCAGFFRCKIYKCFCLPRH